jgi:hypothetical protein
MTKNDTKPQTTETPAAQLPELSLEELATVRGRGCRRGCGSGRSSN